MLATNVVVYFIIGYVLDITELEPKISSRRPLMQKMFFN